MYTQLIIVWYNIYQQYVNEDAFNDDMERYQPRMCRVVGRKLMTSLWSRVSMHAHTHIHTYTCTDIYIKIIHYSMIKAQHLVYDSHLIKTIFNCDINAVIRMIWILNKQPNIVDNCVPCWVPRSNCCWFPHIRSIRSLILHILLH